MMRALRAVCAVSLAILSAAPAARAAFQHPLISPRAAAMGSSSLAVSEDSTSVFLNPAGIAGLKRGDAYFMYNKLHAGLDGVGSIGEGLMSFGLPTRWGTFGLGFGGFRASGLKEELTLSLSYARALLSDRLQLGLSAKRLHHAYSAGSDPLAASDPVFANGTSRSALAFDVGLMAAVAGPLRLGLAVRNVNTPDIGLASEDRVAREIQAGFSYVIGGAGLRATADMLMRGATASGGPGQMLPALGLEKSLYSDKVAFRLGANPQELTGGFGLNMGSIGVDYALVLQRDMMQDNAGSHRIGLRYQFGGAR